MSPTGTAFEGPMNLYSFLSRGAAPGDRGQWCCELSYPGTVFSRGLYRGISRRSVLPSPRLAVVTDKISDGRGSSESFLMLLSDSGP